MKIFVLCALAILFSGCVRYDTEKEFNFSLENGKQIRAEVSYLHSGSINASRTAIFFPKIENTDENLRLVSLEFLSEIHGKQRGSFELKDMEKTSAAEYLVTTCWRLSDSSQKICVLPTSVNDDGIFVLGFWVK